jgi:hypothetical protein
MALKLESVASKQSVRMRAKTFCKLLYLARKQGWNPDRLPSDWPRSNWNTEVILQETEPYRDGLVSKCDARGLTDALTKLVAIEGIAVDPELHAAITQVITVLGKSAFLATEQKTGDTVLFAR